MQFGITVSTVLNGTDGVEFDSSLLQFKKIHNACHIVFTNLFLESPNGKISKSTIRGFDDRKYIQEDKDPKTMKVYLKSVFEVNDNDEMISVKF